ncbi:Aste57867_8549 [Aphanomyces stellatus]|uniref:Aste57867_8549 protein n=1 Tax=Aphanomyces stellatus TaxID=120398 RepID=A0A485KKR9_9STRA|nr:hypothetical protein As57867_008517 [Aphanomyces stellatus]VFT85435.1 Aste57867_8549 [Aphanomyces stellatus]
MKPTPSPRLSGSLSSRLFGHLGDMGVVRLLVDPAGSAAKDGSIAYRTLQRARGWYDETRSSTFRLNMAGRTMVFTQDPLVYKDVLGSAQHHFTNSNVFRSMLRSFVPHSVIVLKGDAWSRVRKIAMRSIAMQTLDTLPRLVGHTVDKLVARQLRETAEPHGDTSLTIDPSEAFPRATFDVFHNVMFKWDPDTVSDNPTSLGILANAMAIVAASGSRVSLPPEWLWHRLQQDGRAFDAAKTALRAQTLSFVDARMAAFEGANASARVTDDDVSLLDCMLVAAADGNLSKNELVDQVLTFFFAAFDTTSSSLSLLLNHLAMHPDVQTTLRAELKVAFPGGCHDIASATIDALDRCTYLTWVVDESLRLAPHAFGISRTCISPCTIAEYAFERGDVVLVDTTNISRNPANYGGQTDLDTFRPDRFEHFGLNKAATMPFGFGQRICPGRKIAVAELKVFCAYVVTGWSLARPPGLPFLMDISLGLGVKKGYGTLVWTPTKG